MKTKSEYLINDLMELTRQNESAAEKIRQEPIEILNWREDAGQWSVLECIEHLNLYGDFYLPEIENRLSTTKYAKPEEIFNSGFIGNYFAKMMLPKEKLNKIKTFKDKDPIGSSLDKSTIDKFINQQNTCLELLNKARKVSLNKTKTAISISKLIKMKLGDTFRVLIYHNQRHLLQAEKVLEKQMIMESIP